MEERKCPLSNAKAEIQSCLSCEHSQDLQKIGQKEGRAGRDQDAVPILGVREIYSSAGDTEDCQPGKESGAEPLRTGFGALTCISWLGNGKSQKWRGPRTPLGGWIVTPEVSRPLTAVCGVSTVRNNWR